MSKKLTVSAQQFAENFNSYFQYRPSDLRVMRMFTPLVDKLEDVNIRKLKAVNFRQPDGSRVPNAIKPILQKTNTHKRIPFEEAYSAAKYIANKISPKLHHRLVSLNKSGYVKDEQLENEFDDEEWEMHVNNSYAADDVLTILHEMGHEICLIPDILSEVPSITTELLADKILEQNGIPSYMFITAKVRRIQEMLGQGYAVDLIAELFDEFEKNGRVMTPKIARELCFYDLNALKEGMIDEVPYFIGAASSLVLSDNIRDKKDYDDTIKILNNRDIGKMRKLGELNINTDTLSKAFDKNVEYNNPTL